MKTIKIYHPKTKKLSGTITELDQPTLQGDLFESIVFGMKDYHVTLQDAKEVILSELSYDYSGQRMKDIAADIRYERMESIACGNY